MRTKKTASMSSARATGIAIRAFSALCAIFVLISTADAAELVMYRRDGCSWCAKWDREIGPIYPKTDISRRVPLKIINLDHDKDLPISHRPIRYTPTFVLVEDAREVGRIEGYPGDEFFWVRLASLLTALDQPRAQAAPADTPAQEQPVMGTPIPERPR
jgi:hypothetical protein